MKTETIWTREEKGNDKYEGGDMDEDEEETNAQRQRREADRNEEDWGLLVQLSESAVISCCAIGSADKPMTCLQALDPP